VEEEEDVRERGGCVVVGEEGGKGKERKGKERKDKEEEKRERQRRDHGQSHIHFPRAPNTPHPSIFKSHNLSNYALRQDDPLEFPLKTLGTHHIGHCQRPFVLAVVKCR
jgi:hypothetical protein